MIQIKKFIHKLQKHLNLLCALRELCNASLICFAGTLLVALIFVLQGYKVDMLWYLIPLVVSALFFIIRYVLKYCNEQRAAAYADKYFDLKNALVTELDFKDQDGAFHALRREQTKNICTYNKIKTIKFKPPRKIILVVFLLLLSTTLLSMLDDSAGIKEAREKEKDIEKTTEQLNNELKKKYEEMLKKLKPKEKKQLKKSGISEAIKKLDKKKDLKKALRQYGKLEHKIKSFAARMKLSEKERLLRMMARKLMKAKMTKNFGQKLKSAKYREAAKDLRKSKFKKNDPKNKMNQLKLKRILEKMLQSAKDAGKMDSSLSKKIEKLLKSMNQNKNCENFDDLEETNADLCEVAEELEDIEDAKKFLKKLQGMSKAFNNAQGKCKSGCKGMGGKGKGKGEGIGSGSAGNFDNKTKDPNDKGYMTGLKGQKKGGKSRIKIQEAETGHGISRRGEREVKTQFKRQMESFISRDDVPPAMKSGVKEYFTKIHENEN